MMNKPKIVIAQVGCGYWGPNLLRNFSSLMDVEVRYLVDASAERRTYVERGFPNTKVTDDLNRVLDDREVSAVIIATPAGTHFEIARRSLLAGKNTFVEKPLAMSTADVDILIALAASAKVVLMAGHTFIYNNAVRYMKKVLDEGDVGRPLYFYSQRLNLGQIRSDVNAWWNLAPHDVSILLYLVGDELPLTVSAHGMDYIQPGIEDVVFATLTWRNKMTASIHVSWLDPHKVRRMTVVGDRKMIMYDDVSDDKIAIYDKGIDRVAKVEGRMDYDYSAGYRLLHRTGDVLLPKISMEEPLQVEAKHFIQCIRDNVEPLTGATHARKVVAVLEAGQKALKSGLKVNL